MNKKKFLVKVIDPSSTQALEDKLNEGYIINHALPLAVATGAI